MFFFLFSHHFSCGSLFFYLWWLKTTKNYLYVMIKRNFHSKHHFSVKLIVVSNSEDKNLQLDFEWPQIMVCFLAHFLFEKTENIIWDLHLNCRCNYIVYCSIHAFRQSSCNMKPVATRYNFPNILNTCRYSLLSVVIGKIICKAIKWYSLSKISQLLHYILYQSIDRFNSIANKLFRSLSS